MKGPQKFVQFLQTSFYHPRSDAHSNAICKFIVEDLVAICGDLGERAASGQLVAAINLTQTVGHDTWNIDLALGPPAGPATPPERDDVVRTDKPAIVQIALEAKGVMTEHVKARRNRLRDFQAFHDHAHRYNSKSIAVGVVVINAAQTYWSPTRQESDLTEHRNVPMLIRNTIDVFRSLPLRDRATGAPGLEAMCVLVVEHDNFGKNPNLPAGIRSKPTALITAPPAPDVGDPLNYASMIYRVCDAYKERFC